ncbi:accessory Sec system S-layer assembly protein [Fredinandcohnia quinoae]|uniref:Accessory Sec system S-layer assembly protein n=1 Tax=Fredinandcohnia quinoae TaxID=2918902 RepID=A0AAW5E651_9BACI|nr:accessory Sec system S-layer assembly protein [Fredinandcohnia sp. SECRCQ15]MCH1625090.1 accessory Sec system S-layer assembly protein [Fredinandcohnia sp. SECRCQ15]
MLSFLKKNKKEELKNKGQESSISSETLLNETSEAKENTEVETSLSLHPNWNLPSEQGYVYRFLNNELDPLKPNQISLSGIEINEEDGNLIVSAFLRNSLSKSITLGNTPLLLSGPNGEILARREFDLTELGEIPAESSRPWHFVFEPSFVLSSEIPSEGWNLAFELKPKHSLQLDENWEKGLSDEAKQSLQEMVDKLGAPKQGEVNFMGLQIQQSEEADLHVTVLIRNGTDKNIQIQHLPLQIEDATGEIIVEGGFALDNFEIVANTSKPWTFIFPKDLIKKENPDLSKWRAIPVQ